MNMYLETPEPEKAQEAPENVQAEVTAVEQATQLAEGSTGAAQTWWNLVAKFAEDEEITDFAAAMNGAAKTYPRSHQAMISEANQR